jgi:hypothetical protein
VKAEGEEAESKEAEVKEAVDRAAEERKRNQENSRVILIRDPERISHKIMM